MVCVLLPAVMLLMGSRTWWLPRWLDRVLPRISVEGDPRRLRRPLPTPNHPPTPDPGGLDVPRPHHHRPGRACGRGGRRTSMLRWVARRHASPPILTVAAIAAWPASEADEAYDDGERYGAAVAQL